MSQEDKLVALVDTLVGTHARTTEVLGHEPNPSCWLDYANAIRELVAENVRLTAATAQQAEEIARLRSALIAHRLDMHMPSNRPCPTCRQSAKALGLTVPEGCARNATDEAALAKLSEGTRT